MTTQTKIVSVWLDETSDDHGWVVDTDLPQGGESDTLRVFPPTPAGRAEAVAYARQVGAKRGCKVRE